jgi:hypothetical protein
MQQVDGELSDKNGGRKRNHLSQDFVITRETPNQQSKNRFAYNYRTPTRFFLSRNEWGPGVIFDLLQTLILLFSLLFLRFTHQLSLCMHSNRSN